MYINKGEIFFYILFEWYPQTMIDCRKTESHSMIQNQIYQ